MIPPEKYPHESHDQSLHESLSHSNESIESTDTLKRLIVRQAFIEHVGIAGIRLAPTGSADGKLSVHDVAENGGSSRYIGAPELEADISPSEILNHALMLEAIEAEFVTLIAGGKTVPEIRFSIGTTQFGVSTPDFRALQCRVAVRVLHNLDIEPCPEKPAANARSKPARNSHRPRGSPSPGKRRSLTSPTRPRSRSTTDHTRRRPRRSRSHPPLP
jgi:hypothetical protein